MFNSRVCSQSTLIFEGMALAVRTDEDSIRPKARGSPNRSLNQRLWFRSRSIDWKQEIIKVREWIPHVGPLIRVIPPKLFLDIVPSSSADVTRAMRGQPKWLFSKLQETKWRKRYYIWFNFLFWQRYSLHSAVFLFDRAFVCFCVRLAVHYLAVSVLVREFN